MNALYIIPRSISILAPVMEMKVVHMGAQFYTLTPNLTKLGPSIYWYLDTG